MEPIIGVNFAHFLPYGSGQFNSGNRLVGPFGSAALEGVSDHYSHLVCKVCCFAVVCHLHLVYHVRTRSVCVLHLVLHVSF